MKPIEWAPPLGLPLGLVLGRALGDGDMGGPDEGACVGDGWTVPLQGTPLSAKLDGTGLLLLFHEPLKPKLVPPSVARLPFQPALLAETCAPLWVTVAFHA
jgi:hypothetical protein